MASSATSAAAVAPSMATVEAGLYAGPEKPPVTEPLKAEPVVKEDPPVNKVDDQLKDPNQCNEGENEYEVECSNRTPFSMELVRK